MNIPDEVKNAALAEFERVAARSTVGRAVPATWQVIAEWARKEALEHAQQTIATLEPDRTSVNFNNVGGWVLGKQAAFNAIRALVDGDKTDD